MNRTFCNTTCSHGGICTLEVDHDGLHSAGGWCEWERSEDDNIESDIEATLNTLDLMADPERFLSNFEPFVPEEEEE